MPAKAKKRYVFLFALAVSGLFVLLTACGQRQFNGTRVADQDSYRLDMEQMDGTDTHTLKLDAGDVLDIRFETEHGKLHMEIKAPDGTLIYSGNGEGATDFTVNISAGGAYSVRVEARNAKGEIRIQRTAGAIHHIREPSMIQTRETR